MIKIGARKRNFTLFFKLSFLTFGIDFVDGFKNIFIYLFIYDVVLN